MTVLIVSKSSLVIEPLKQQCIQQIIDRNTVAKGRGKGQYMREAFGCWVGCHRKHGTKSRQQDTSTDSGNYTTQAVDLQISESQHTEQSEPNYDTHLLETTIDSNTTPTSTNMCHRGGEIDALLNAELLKTKDMLNRLSYLRLCLTGKTSGSDKPRHPVLQMLASHKSPVLKDPKKKVTPLLIPYGRFSKVIIYYLASKNNIHRRPDSAVHHTGDDFILGNLKFVPKVKQSKPAPAPTKKPSKHKLPQKIRKGKPTFQLVDEDDEAQQESIPQEEGDDPDLDLAKKMSFWTHQRKGKGEGDDADMERAIKLSLDPAFLPQGQAPVGGLGIQYLKQLPNCLKYNTGQAFLYHPKKAHEALAGPDPEPSKNTRLYHSGKLHVSLAGPNPEHMDDEFLAR
ncbi:hypothetical protein Tco_0329230 [Tanacetum coccineum]